LWRGGEDMKEGKTKFISAKKLLFTMHEARDLQSMSPSMSPRYTQALITCLSRTQAHVFDSQQGF
jgi:hypothetical protein